MPYPLDAPDRLTPEERRREIASILARGILRLHQTRQLKPESASTNPAEHAPETPHKGLEVSEASRPHVTNG